MYTAYLQTLKPLRSYKVSKKGFLFFPGVTAPVKVHKPMPAEVILAAANSPFNKPNSVIFVVDEAVCLVNSDACARDDLVESVRLLSIHYSPEYWKTAHRSFESIVGTSTGQVLTVMTSGLEFDLDLVLCSVNATLLKRNVNNVKIQRQNGESFNLKYGVRPPVPFAGRLVGEQQTEACSWRLRCQRVYVRPSQFRCVYYLMRRSEGSYHDWSIVVEEETPLGELSHYFQQLLQRKSPEVLGQDVLQLR